MFEITREPLDPAPLVAAVRRDECGAVALFYGVVRNENLGRAVSYLEYDAYPEMAVKKMREVADEVRVRFPITGIGVLHRVGRLEIGETSLLVAVSSGHRKEAFDACHYAPADSRSEGEKWNRPPGVISGRFRIRGMGQPTTVERSVSKQLLQNTGRSSRGTNGTVASPPQPAHFTVVLSRPEARSLRRFARQPGQRCGSFSSPFSR
jgi:molybdopterin synthase catalytic subunit